MAVHPLRPATDRRLGRPLPHQPANQTRVHLYAAASLDWPPFLYLRCQRYSLFGISSRFQLLFRSYRQVTHALLTRSPLTLYPLIRKSPDIQSVRLACVRHAASVRPEPGSNSPLYSSSSFLLFFVWLLSKASSLGFSSQSLCFHGSSFPFFSLCVLTCSFLEVSLELSSLVV